MNYKILEMESKFERKNKRLKEVSFKKSLLKFLSSSILFILFALFNGLIPLVICLLLAQAVNGTQYVMSIGYITAIQLGFVQLSWTIGLATIYSAVKISKKNEINSYNEFCNIVPISLLLTLIYAAIITPLFIGVSYAYNRFASNHINTLIGQTQAYYYIYSVSGYIFLSGFIFTLIIYIQANNKKILASFLAILFACLCTGFLVIAIYVPKMSETVSNVKLTNYNYGVAAGLAMTLAALFSFGITLIVFKMTLNIPLISNGKYKNHLKDYFKNSWKQLITILSIQLFKAAALIGMGCTIQATLDGLVPISYQLARAVWYNLMYLLPFLGIGFADAILFFGLRERNVSYTHINKILIFLVIFLLGFQVAYSFALYEAIEPISRVYLKNLVVSKPTSSEINQIDFVFSIQQLLKKQEYIDKLTQMQQLLSTPSGEQIVNAKISAMLSQILSNNPSIPPQLQQIIIKTVSPQLTNVIKTNWIPGLLNESTRVQTIEAIQGFLQNPLGSGVIKLPLPPNVQLPPIDLLPQAKVFLWNFVNSTDASVVFGKYFQTSNASTFIFLCVWCFTYPCAFMFLNTGVILRQQVNSLFRTLITLVVQAGVISAIVGIGVTCQYTASFPLLDSWTLPLVIMGPIALAYYIILYVIQFIKIKKNHGILLKKNINEINEIIKNEQSF